MLLLMKNGSKSEESIKKYIELFGIIVCYIKVY